MEKVYLAQMQLPPRWHLFFTSLCFLLSLYFLGQVFVGMFLEKKKRNHASLGAISERDAAGIFGDSDPMEVEDLNPAIPSQIAQQL